MYDQDYMLGSNKAFFKQRRYFAEIDIVKAV